MAAMDPRSVEPKIDHALERARRGTRSLARRTVELLRDPARLLVVGVGVGLVALALPLLVGGGSRLGRAFGDWRHRAAIDRHWVRTSGHVMAVRSHDGLALRVGYRDRAGNDRQAVVTIDTTDSGWLRTTLPVRYDPHHTSRIDLVGVGVRHPLVTVLVAGAALGAGGAAAIMAWALWRRRRLLVVSAAPIAALQVPLAVAGGVFGLGVGAWAAGTVIEHGVSGVGDRIGALVSRIFGDLVGVGFPLLAFAAGCLLTAWLARHRPTERDGGLLGRTYGIIDRAAGYVPSPEELRRAAGVRDREDPESRGATRRPSGGMADEPVTRRSRPPAGRSGGSWSGS